MTVRRWTAILAALVLTSGAAVVTYNTDGDHGAARTLVPAAAPAATVPITAPVPTFTGGPALVKITGNGDLGDILQCAKGLTPVPMVVADAPMISLGDSTLSIESHDSDGRIPKGKQVLSLVLHPNVRVAAVVVVLESTSVNFPDREERLPWMMSWFTNPGFEFRSFTLDDWPVINGQMYKLMSFTVCITNRPPLPTDA